MRAAMEWQEKLGAIIKEFKKQEEQLEETKAS